MSDVTLRPDGPDLQKPAGMGQSLDEIFVLNPASFHLERMAKNNYWIGIDLADGGTLRIVITAARAGIHAYAEQEKP